jgi:hypothetical protein
MASEVHSNAVLALTGAMESVLELAGAGRVVEACNRLASVLETLKAPPHPDLPDGARPDLYRLLAILTLPSWEEVSSAGLHSTSTYEISSKSRSPMPSA